MVCERDIVKSHTFRFLKKAGGVGLPGRRDIVRAACMYMHVSFAPSVLHKFGCLF
ncbi:hypothetical protein Mpsy_2454 [Methanolobus psychrophilus R15]|nr:hypothetical protein Mpsy_2454 [Methanolobus psychrophilus R15]